MSTAFVAYNGAIDRLGDDELAYIMNLVAGDSGRIPEKLALAQVSQRWRALAITTSTIWSKFTVRTRGDALCVPTMMERVRGALLHVSLDFSLRREPKDAATPPTVPWIGFDTRAVVYAYLSPQVYRIRSLSIDFGPATSVVGPGEPLDEVFSFAVSQMRDLSIHWRTTRWLREPGAVHAVQQVRPIVIPLELPTEITPRLRSVSLTNVVPTDWSAVIIPTLEHLYLDVMRLDDSSLFYRILRTCPRLIHLTFLPAFVALPTAGAMAGPNPPPSVCTRLHSVHLGSPFRSLWMVLRAMVNCNNLDSISVNLRDEDPRRAITVARMILPGLGLPVACSLVPADLDTRESQFRVEDAAGRNRQLIMPRVHEDRNSFARLWSDLASHGDLDTIQRVTFWQRYWLLVVEAFDQERPRHPNLELRVVHLLGSGGCQVDETLVTTMTHPHELLSETLHCPGLAKLTFDIGDALPGTMLATVLTSLDRIAGRDEGQSTQVCVANCSQRELWVLPMRDALASREGWVLCEHGCSHI